MDDIKPWARIAAESTPETAAQVMAINGHGFEDIYIALDRRIPIDQCWKIVLQWGGRKI